MPQPNAAWLCQEYRGRKDNLGPLAKRFLSLYFPQKMHQLPRTRCYATKFADWGKPAEQLLIAAGETFRGFAGICA